MQPANSSFAGFFFCLSGALRQEKLELSAQVKKLHATVDHLQGSLNQAHEEVSLDLQKILITGKLTRGEMEWFR